MFDSHIILASFIILALHGSYAAECCSWQHTIDTDHLRNLAERFCADPLSHLYTQGTGKTEYWELNEGKYNILGTHWQRTFPNCTNALENIITECQGKGFGVGTWGTEVLKPKVDDNIGEFYSITADEYYDPKRRDLSALQPFPTEGDVASGTYSFDGLPLEVIIRDEGVHNQAMRALLPRGPADASSDFLFRRNAQPLMTTYGETSHWDQRYTNNVDLASLIASSTRQKRRRTTKKKRLLDKWFPKCQTKGHTYVVIAAGTWRTDPAPSGSTLMCGAGSGCTSRLHSSDRTWDMSIKFGYDGDSKGRLTSGDALDAGRDVGIPWVESNNITGEPFCSWSQGMCHRMFHQMEMGWTRGYRLLNHENMVEVHIVHVDAPLENGYRTRCDVSCCHPAVPMYSQPLICKNATDENREWYGVCSGNVQPVNGSCRDIKS